MEATAGLAPLLGSAHAALRQAEALLRAGTPDAGLAAWVAWEAEQLDGQLALLKLRAAAALRTTGAHQLPAAAYQQIQDAGAEPGPEDLAPMDPEPGRKYFKDAKSMLADWLGVPVGAAGTRLAQVEALLGAVGEDGSPLPAAYPALAGQLERDDIDARLVLSAATKLRGAERDVRDTEDPDAVRARLDEAAAQLVEHEPHNAARLLGTLITEQAVAQRSYQSMFDEAGIFFRGTKRGLSTWVVKMMPEQAELMASVISQIDNPATIAGNRQALEELAAAAATGEGAAPEYDDQDSMPGWAREPEAPASAQEPAEPEAPATAEAPAELENSPAAPSATDPLPPGAPPVFEDLRPEQRHLVGFTELLKNCQGTGTGSVTPEFIVTLDYDKLVSGAPLFATTAHGLPLPAAAARTALCNAGVLPMVLGSKSEILDLGRSQRLFPKHMKKALQAKFRGCAYPGCSMPAGRCEADHLVAWEDGGPTSLENGCLFCPMHHHARHAGLFTVVRPDGGPPRILLPKDLDPHQVPRVNTYWMSTAEALAVNQPRPLAS